MTTWMDRFREALRLMCGALPPQDMCREWVDDVQVDCADRLQAWVLSQPGTPTWAQGIVTIEAAMAWADQPEEGVGHRGRKKNEDGHYPVEWGPSDNRRLTCSCGHIDPNHQAQNSN